MSTNHHTPLASPISNFVSALNTIFAALDEAITNRGRPAPVAQGRLSPSSSLALPTGVSSAPTTLYYLPFKGDQLAIYDNSASKWVTRTIPSAGVSLAVPSSANTNYDIFAYWTGSAIALEAVAWTNDTTRATALVDQDGVQVKTGGVDRLYLGTIRTTSAGQTANTLQKRLIWNRYNRVPARMYAGTASSHTYNSTAIRKLANGDNWTLQFVQGLQEDIVRSELYATANGTDYYFAIGANQVSIDSVITPVIESATVREQGPAIYEGYGQLGYNELYALERVVSGSSTATVNSLQAFEAYGHIGRVWY